MLSAFVLSCVLSSVLGGVVPSGLKPIIDGRIVGGEIATIEEMPYQCAILHYTVHRCGAAIINPTTVITAAHCTEDSVLKRLAVLAGSVERAKGDVIIPVKKFATHPNYDPDNIDHDMAIMWLETPLTFNEKIQPIGLPDFNEPIRTGSIGIVSGWGLTSENGERGMILRYVAVPVIDQEKCVKMSPYDLVSKYMVCAGYPEGGKDACQQDSGGPFVIENKLVGVVSWARGCARPNTPGVYARVASMRDWIDEVVEA